jgi:hypothetical protein
MNWMGGFADGFAGEELAGFAGGPAGEFGGGLVREPSS